ESQNEGWDLPLARSRAVLDVLSEPSAIPAQLARSAGPTLRAKLFVSCSRRCRAARCSANRANLRRSASQRQLAADPRVAVHHLGLLSAMGEGDSIRPNRYIV